MLYHHRRPPTQFHAEWRRADDRGTHRGATIKTADRSGMKNPVGATYSKVKDNGVMESVEHLGGHDRCRGHEWSCVCGGCGDTGSVIAMNQKAKGEGVSITYAFAPKDGTLAIFSVDPQKRTGVKPLGEAGLSPGDHRDVSVKLSPEPKSGTRLWAVIEQGKGGKPFRNLDGPAEQSFKVM